MSGTDPWWFTGTMPDDASLGPRDRRQGGGFSLSFLASGAQQLVDMAKQAIVVPHADHDDPEHHGDCIICRGQLALGEVRGRPNAPDVDVVTETNSESTVEWIHLDAARPAASESLADRRLWP